MLRHNLSTICFEEDNMKIVVLDGYTENPGDLSWEEIRGFGELTVYDRTPSDDSEIIRRIGDAEIVLTNKTPVSAAVIKACDKLKYISVLATGYNIVDVKAATEKKILVSNIPTYGTASVAQFAISMLLEICGHVGHHSNAVHSGRWTQSKDFCFWDYPLIELSGKTIGIIGIGRIGQAVARIANSLGMRVIAYSRSMREEIRDFVEFVDFNTLLSESDVISLHCPLFPETKEIINRDSISKMRNGVIILNNSRGQLINEQDLADALKSGKVYAAAVDVVSTEPISADNPLLTAPNCMITPHISWAPKESRQRIMTGTAENIRAFISGKPINLVNY